MKPTPEQGLPKAFLDRLLDRVDPHQLHTYPVMPNAMLLCARWIALRRLRLNLTIEDIVRRTRVDANLFELIEAGQGYARDLLPEQIIRLGNLLASSRADQAWAGKVIALALGKTLPNMAQIVNRVALEIETATTVVPAAAASESARTHAQAQQPAGLLDADIFALLAMLFSPQHSYTIAEQLSQDRPGDIRINDAMVAAYIQKMLEDDLIKLVDERIDHDIDTQMRPYYQITDAGNQVYNAEVARRKLQSTSTTRGPIRTIG